MSSKITQVLRQGERVVEHGDVTFEEALGAHARPPFSFRHEVSVDEPGLLVVCGGDNEFDLRLVDPDAAPLCEAGRPRTLRVRVVEPNSDGVNLYWNDLCNHGAPITGDGWYKSTAGGWFRVTWRNGNPQVDVWASSPDAKGRWERLFT